MFAEPYKPPVSDASGKDRKLLQAADKLLSEAGWQVKNGKFAGGSDLLFNLKNGGMGVGKINPQVPAADITLMNKYRQQIIDGKLKVPAAV